MAQADAHVTVWSNFCIESAPEPSSMVIFGASGDLVRRKLVPALFSLHQRKLLPKQFSAMGFARSQMGDEAFRDQLRSSLVKGLSPEDTAEADAFLTKFRYMSGDYNDPDAYRELDKHCDQCGITAISKGNRLFYLALPPHLHPVVAERLSEAGLTHQGEDGRPWARVIFEKPFGYDLASALDLDSRLSEVLEANQVYRMDHYLGKETVQSILIFRFANAIFEPIWNRDHIDHIQITASETLGMEHRGAYYEGAGCLRDMFQNHMLQMLALVTMEPPNLFYAEQVRDERTKLLRAIRPWPLRELDRWIVRGQYQPGQMNGTDVPGYRQEPGVQTVSATETYAAAKVLIDNWRWRGVPFYLRSGKRMPAKSSEIVVTFKPVPHSLFRELPPERMPPNVLVLKIQPEEGVKLEFQAKQPGPKWCMSTLAMSFKYQEVFGIDPPEAYGRLLLDCMLGDQTLFWRREEVEASWSLITPVLDRWVSHPGDCPLKPYTAGSWGPKEADGLMVRDGRAWRNSVAG